MILPEIIYHEYPHEESDIYSIPYVVNRQSLMTEFNALIGNFVSYKDASGVGQQLNLLFRLLESMQQRKPEEANGIAREMLDRLLALDTDDDDFPIPEIEMLYALLGEKKTYAEICEQLNEKW